MRSACLQEVDAAVIFGELDPGAGSVAYTIRMNHTAVPPTRQVLNIFDLQPDEAYKEYWFFANLQQLLDETVLAHAAASSAGCQQAGGDSEPMCQQLLGLRPAAAQSSMYAAASDLGGRRLQKAGAAGGQLLGSSVRGAHLGTAGTVPIDATQALAVRFKPFPWPAATLDLGAGTAGLAFNLLLVFAFLSPTRY